MNLLLVTYKVSHLKGNASIHRKVFGYVDRKGKYEYNRPGKISPFILAKHSRGTFMTEERHLNAIEKIMKEYQLHYIIRNPATGKRVADFAPENFEKSFKPVKNIIPKIIFKEVQEVVEKPILNKKPRVFRAKPQDFSIGEE